MFTAESCHCSQEGMVFVGRASALTPQGINWWWTECDSKPGAAHLMITVVLSLGSCSSDTRETHITPTRIPLSYIVFTETGHE